VPGLWNEFQLEGAGSRRLLANGRVGMAASRSPKRSGVGTSNGTRRRPGEHREGSTQAGHGGAVLSATNRLQRQSRTPIQPPQSDPPVDPLEPERVEQRQHVAGRTLTWRVGPAETS
jgi:hypothetical protein